METHMQDVQNITAFFDDRGDADKAVGKLEQGGIPRSSIQMVEGRDPNQKQTKGSSDAGSSKDEGFMASLKEMFMGSDDSNKNDHDSYAEGLRRGGYLVSVKTPSADRQRVTEILDKDGSVDMDERSES